MAKTMKEIAQEKKATGPTSQTPPQSKVSAEYAAALAEGPDGHFWAKVRKEGTLVRIVLQSGVNFIGNPKGFGRFWLSIDDIHTSEKIVINKTAIATIQRCAVAIEEAQ